MTTKVDGRYEVRVALPATLDAVEEFIARTRTIWTKWKTRHNDFATELLLREALANAVTHGCGEDSSKSIRCVIRLKHSSVFFAVEDDGAGFDWRSSWENRSTADECSGRGMEILQKYASRVRFNRQGNQVAVAIRISAKEST